jgi:hypothetical protein
LPADPVIEADTEIPAAARALFMPLTTFWMLSPAVVA